MPNADGSEHAGLSPDQAELSPGRDVLGGEDRVTPPVMAPSARLAETLSAREHWQALEPVLLVLIEDGHLDFATAVSWLAAPDDALDGLSPAQWVEVGRDSERLLLIARRDAARLAQ